MVYNYQQGIISAKSSPMLFIGGILLSILMVLGVFVSAFAATPSSNETNKDNGWAHFNATPSEDGVSLELVSTRNFASCFEYRTDGDIGQQTSENNFNPAIDDGLYPFVCVNNTTQPLELEADEYVEVRMVFGAESDERFDWTRVDVLQPATPQTKDDCKNGGFANYGFKNQGQCIASIQSNGNSAHNRR